MNRCNFANVLQDLILDDVVAHEFNALRQKHALVQAQHQSEVCDRHRKPLQLVDALFNSGARNDNIILFDI